MWKRALPSLNFGLALGLAVGLGLAAGSASAQKTTIYKVTYEDRSVTPAATLEGRLVLPQPRSARLPLVVLYPDWMGVTSRAVDDAQRIAAWGYAVFVADPGPTSQELQAIAADIVGDGASEASQAGSLEAAPVSSTTPNVV